jgi:signal transduction histidine kinase
MEFWIIISKLILLVYLGARFIYANHTNISWIVFFILLYLCINIAIYIVKGSTAKRIIILLSILINIISFKVVDPLFILLLPLNICELASYYISSKWKVLLLLLIPIFFMKESMVLLYGFTAMPNFVIFTILEKYTSRLTKLESQMDKMRKDMQRLTKSLYENNEFIRQSEYTFKLEERNRLSQVIHDKIGHSMTGALIQMEASKRLIETDKEKAKELLQNAINISKDGIENIRITLKNMKPPTEQMGINRLKLFIDEFSAKHHLHIPFVFNGKLEVITPIQWKIIHENITEALTNALKYSDASTISIEINVLNAIARVVVKDNGKGAEKIKKSLGIIGMEERTASINGKIIVDGANGFSVTMLLPVYG